jgi:hypothetical protein
MFYTIGLNWACTIKLFTAVISPYRNKLECLLLSLARREKKMTKNEREKKVL